MRHPSSIATRGLVGPQLTTALYVVVALVGVSLSPSGSVIAGARANGAAPGWTVLSLPAWARPTDRYSTAFLDCPAVNACISTVATAAFTKAGTIYTTNGTTWRGTTRTWITQVGKKKYKQPYGFGVPECVSASVCFAAAQGGGAGSNVVSTADGGKPREPGPPGPEFVRHCAMAAPARSTTRSPAMKAGIRFISVF